MVDNRSRTGDDASSADALQEPLLPSTTTATDAVHNNRRRCPGLAMEDKDIVIRGCFPRPSCRRRRRQRNSNEWLRLNHNVFLNFALMITYGISEGLWGGAVYAAYVKQLYGGKNAPLGKIEAVYSLAELIFAVPIGYMADHYGRSKIIKAGSLLFLGTAMAHAVITYWISTDHNNTGNATTTIILMIIMALWGIGSGIVDGPCEALFADSTPPGRRTHYYTYLEILYLLATVLGPLLSLIIFQSYASDDQWNMKALVIIIYVGLAMEAGNALIMMLFDDDKALVEDDDNEEESSSSSSSESSSEDEQEEEEEEEEEKVNEEERNDDNDDRQEEEGNENPLELPQVDQLPEEATTTTATTVANNNNHQWTIPYIMLASELVWAASIGLTDAYFPLFLKDDCGMSPAQVQILYAVEPIFIAVMTWAAARTARSLGRVPTILLFNAAAILFFAAIPLLNFGGQQQGKHNHSLWLLMVLRILSSSFGDSFHPLEEALLADSLPRNKRARWMSLCSSLSGLHQSATAILGGYLSDYWGYRGTFLATCAGETVALGLFALLLPVVKPRERRLTNHNIQPSHEDAEQEALLPSTPVNNDSSSSSSSSSSSGERRGYSAAGNSLRGNDV